MTLYDFHEALVGLLSRRKVILRVCKGIVKVKVVNFNRDTFKLGVSSFDRA